MLNALMNPGDRQRRDPAKSTAFVDSPRNRRLAELAPLLRAVIARTLGEPPSHPDVQDATHEALRRALESDRSAQDFRPWVLGIARHVAIDVIRARQRSRARELSVNHDPGARASALELPDPGPGPDQQLRLGQDRERLLRALDTLPPSEKRALVLFHVDGLSYREISTELDTSLGTICTWISRARRKVAAAIRDQEKP